MKKSDRPLYAAKHAEGFRFIASMKKGLEVVKTYFREENDLIEFTMNNPVFFIGTIDASGTVARIEC